MIEHSIAQRGGVGCFYCGESLRLSINLFTSDVFSLISGSRGWLETINPTDVCCIFVTRRNRARNCLTLFLETLIYRGPPQLPRVIKITSQLASTWGSCTCTAERASNRLVVIIVEQTTHLTPHPPRWVFFTPFAAPTYSESCISVTTTLRATGLD